MTMLRAAEREVYSLHREADYLALADVEAPIEISARAAAPQLVGRIAAVATLLAGIAAVGSVIALHGTLSVAPSGGRVAAIPSAGTRSVVGSQEIRADSIRAPQRLRPSGVDTRVSATATRGRSAVRSRAGASPRRSHLYHGVAAAPASRGSIAVAPASRESPPRVPAAVSARPPREPLRAPAPAASLAASARSGAGQPEFGFER
jgi:hypothetical protein